MPIGTARFRISDYNQKRKSNLKKSERKIRMVSLSLTSMVDMFAILVIFLLTNQDTVTQWVEVGHGIQLPQAKSHAPPTKAGTLQIADSGVYADTSPLMTVEQVMTSPDILEPLRGWLGQQGNNPKNAKGYLNVVAHTKVPFGVVRKVVATAQSEGYTNVNLAVEPQ